LEVLAQVPGSCLVVTQSWTSSHFRERAMFRVVKDCVFQGNFTAKEVDMTGKTVVITGPSRGGIGFETAFSLAKQGAKVLFAARNLEKATKELEDMTSMATLPVKPELFKCDVSSVESARKCAEEILKEHSVDVLINNAGAVFEEKKKNDDGVEITFATCVLGHHMLNFLLKPQRIVWVTGDIYAIANGSANPSFEGKGFSSYANACLARIMLAREMKSRGIATEIIAVHPGVIRSQFAKPKNCCEGFVMNWCDCSRIDVVKGAQSSIYAATCPSSDLPKETIYFHNKYGWYVLKPGDLAVNEARCKSLFDECDALCGISR